MRLIRKTLNMRIFNTRAPDDMKQHFLNLNKNIIMERKENMKKRVLLAVLVAIAAIVGCGTVNNKAVSQKNDKTNVTEHVLEERNSTETVENSESVSNTEGSEVDALQNSTENQEETVPVNSYTELNETMYSSSNLNVRNMPSIDGEVIGRLSYNQEVNVTGKCNETGWYRINFNGGEGFVSDKYIVREKKEAAIQDVTSNIQSQNNSSSDASVQQPVANNGDWVQNLGVAQQTSQLVIVSAKGSSATVSLHNKNNDGSWSEIFSTNGRIGKNGVGKTREGDNKTPVGTYGFTMAFGNAGNPGSTIGYLQTDSSYYWVDDSNSTYYNKMVSTNEVTCDWSSAEHISDVGVYKYALAVNYNSSCTPGAGSAIFFHCSRGSSTAGCIAIPEGNMIQLMQNLRGDCIIVIDSASNINNY